jgi:hypothetical protein
MKPTRASAVIEIFYPGGFAHDYHWTTRALGMDHYAVWNDRWDDVHPKRPPNLIWVWLDIIRTPTSQKWIILKASRVTIFLSTAQLFLGSSRTTSNSNADDPSASLRRILWFFSTVLRSLWDLGDRGRTSWTCVRRFCAVLPLLSFLDVDLCPILGTRASFLGLPYLRLIHTTVCHMFRPPAEIYNFPKFPPLPRHAVILMFVPRNLSHWCTPLIRPVL